MTIDIVGTGAAVFEIDYKSITYTIHYSYVITYVSDMYIICKILEYLCIFNV